MGLGLLVASAVGLFGLIILIELLYHRTLESAMGMEMNLFGRIVDTAAPSAWFAGAALALVGVSGFLFFRSGFMTIWDNVNADIDKSDARGGR